jgi:hypothetical protein
MEEVVAELWAERVHKADIEKKSVQLYKKPGYKM